jgi:hypothetical protein
MPITSPCLSLTEMTSRVRSVVRDADSLFITDNDITDWLNEGAGDLASRLDILRKEVTGSMSGSPGNTIALPPTPTDQEPVLRITMLRLATVEVEFVDDDTWYAYSDSGFNLPHTIGREFGGTVYVYPTPSTGTTYSLQYSYLPQALSAGADISPLPCQFHMKLVRYAQAQAYYKLDEMGRADRAMANYEQGLPPVDLGGVKLVPGPVVLQMTPGPFDLDDEQHF